MTIDKVAWRKEPMWKARLQIKIEELRKDLYQLNRKIKILVVQTLGKIRKKI